MEDREAGGKDRGRETSQEVIAIGWEEGTLDQDVRVQMSRHVLTRDTC